MVVERSIRFGIDSRGARQGAEEYSRALDKVATDAQSAAKSNDRFEESIEAIRAAARDTVAAINGVANEVRGVQQGIGGLATRFEEVAADVLSANRGMGQFGDTLGRVAQQARSAGSAIESLRSLQDLGGYGLSPVASPSFANGGYGDLAGGTLERSIQATAAQVAALRSLGNNGGYGGISAIAPPEESAAVVDRISAVGSSLALLRTQALSAFGAFAGAQALREGISAITDFEKSIKQIAVVGEIDETSAQFQTLVETAREIGRTTQFSAGRAAEGLLELTKAGLSATESVQAIAPAIDLAVAGDVSLQRASEVLLSTMAQFGKEAAESRAIADSLVKQANISQSSVEGIAQGLANVGPVANKLGISFEQTAALLGVLNDNAVKGAEAGTALRTVFAALLERTDAQQRALAKLGLTFEDINPAVNDITTIFEKISAAGAAAEDTRQIFGTYGFVAASIFGDAADKVREYEAAIQNAKGTSQEAAVAIGDTLGGSFNKMKGALESVAISLGNAGLTGILRFLTERVAELSLGIDGLVESAAKLKQIGTPEGATPYTSRFPTGENPLIGIVNSPEFAARERSAGFSQRYRAYQQSEVDAISAISASASLPRSPFAPGASTAQFQPLQYTLDIPFGPEAPAKQQPFVTYPSTGQAFGPQQGALDALKQELDFRKSLIGATDEQVRLAEELRRAQQAALDQYGPGSPEGAAALEKYIELAKQRNELEKANAKAMEESAAAARKAAEAEAKRAAEVQQKAGEIAGAVTDPIRSGLNTGLRGVLDGGDFDFGDIGRKIGTDILSGLLDQILISPITEAIKSALAQSVIVQNTAGAVTSYSSGIASVVGAFLAKGGVVSGGSLMPFARGGAFAGGNVIPFAAGGYVTNGPEIFPLSGGNIGLRGEAGNEAILPLKRTASGDLGVKAEVGGSGSGITQIIQHITTRDADSFRRSRGHMLADEKRMRRRWGLRN